MFLMITERVKNTIKKYRLIGKNNKIVVAVSGGPDSVALLYLLNGLKKELNLILHIAHLDHMLRKGSHKDAEFVRGLAQNLNIPLTSAQINVKRIASKGSVEEIARNARLGFLFKVARDIKADRIAIGHNLDDQAETVLMRILRGSGLHGLSGILPKRTIAGYEIIRPLIEVKRKEIRAYLKRKKIQPLEDPTNEEDVYFRNKIRNNLLPLLEKDYNRNIKELLSNMAESVGVDYDYLNCLARQKVKVAKTKISLKKLTGLHPALQRLIFRNAIAYVKGDTRRITFRHIKEIEDLFLNRPLNSIVDLPGGVSVIKSRGHLSFYIR